MKRTLTYAETAAGSWALFVLLSLPTVAFGFFWAPLEEDNVAILTVDGDPNVIPIFWHDSYSVGDRCYCESTFDHDVGGFTVDEDTPLGSNATIREICDYLGPGPGSWGRPKYNDIQCGNGPPNNDAKRDEITCPGRVEYGENGCGYIGPKWNWNTNDVDKDGTIFSNFLSWLYLTVFSIFSPFFS